MQVEKDLLPAIDAIVMEAEDKLSKLVGAPVRMKINFRPAELNQAFLQELVCEAFCVTWQDIIGGCREEDIKNARHVYWWLNIRYLDKSVSTMKRETKMRDHASVIHGRDRIQEIMDNPYANPRLAKKIKIIEEEIVNGVYPPTE